MTKLDELEAAFASEQKTQTCKIGKVLNGLDAEERSLVEAKIGDQTYSPEVLVRVFGRLHIMDVSFNTMRNHRKGVCACSPR